MNSRILILSDEFIPTRVELFDNGSLLIHQGKDAVALAPDELIELAKFIKEELK